MSGAKHLAAPRLNVDTWFLVFNHCYKHDVIDFV